MSEELSAGRTAAAEFTVPTAKVLEIGCVTDRGTPEAMATLLSSEARDTVRLHLAGKTEQ